VSRREVESSSKIPEAEPSSSYSLRLYSTKNVLTKRLLERTKCSIPG